MSYIEPFDFRSVFVNTFSGSYIYFIAIIGIILTFLAAKFRMTNVMFGLSFVLFFSIMSYWFPIWFAVIVMITGLIIYSVYGRPLKQ